VAARARRACAGGIDEKPVAQELVGDDDEWTSPDAQIVLLGDFSGQDIQRPVTDKLSDAFTEGGIDRDLVTDIGVVDRDDYVDLLQDEPIPDMNSGCDDHNGAHISVNIVKLHSICNPPPQRMQIRAYRLAILFRRS
jgi:hypothetical protein